MVCDEAAQNIDWQFTNKLMADKPGLSQFAAAQRFLGLWLYPFRTARIEPGTLLRYPRHREYLLR